MNKLKYIFGLAFFLFSFIILNAQDFPKLIPFLKGNLFGFVNQNKKMIIEPKFTNAYPFGYSHKYSFYPNFALVQIDETMYLVDEKGKLTEQEIFNQKNEGYDFPPPQIQSVGTIKYNVFEKNGKKGIQDGNNKTIIDAIYDDLELYYFSEIYYNKKLKKDFKPTFAIAAIGETRKIIRVDQFKIYENVSLSSFTSNSDHMIVYIKNKDNSFSNGILTKDKLLKINSKYLRINKYYEDQKLISVDKIVNKHPVSFFIDLKGNEYLKE